MALQDKITIQHDVSLILNVDARAMEGDVRVFLGVEEIG